MIVESSPSSATCPLTIPSSFQTITCLSIWKLLSAIIAATMSGHMAQCKRGHRKLFSKDSKGVKHQSLVDTTVAIKKSLFFNSQYIVLYLIFFQKPGKQESTEEEDLVKHLDPLHQLIHLFSRTALTEKWWAIAPLGECPHQHYWWPPYFFDKATL